MCILNHLHRHRLWRFVHKGPLPARSSMGLIAFFAIARCARYRCCCCCCCLLTNACQRQHNLPQARLIPSIVECCVYARLHPVEIVVCAGKFTTRHRKAAVKSSYAYAVWLHLLRSKRFWRAFFVETECFSSSFFLPKKNHSFIGFAFVSNELERTIGDTQELEQHSFLPIFCWCVADTFSLLPITKNQKSILSGLAIFAAI